jgi:hypothetical protein
MQVILKSNSKQWSEIPILFDLDEEKILAPLVQSDIKTNQFFSCTTLLPTSAVCEFLKIKGFYCVYTRNYNGSIFFSHETIFLFDLLGLSQNGFLFIG